MGTVDTHKASTSVTESRPFVCGFMEVMGVIEVVAQLSTYRHSPHEVRVDFFTADLSLPEQKKKFQCAMQKWVRPFNNCLVFALFLLPRHDGRPVCACCSFLTCQFHECWRKRGSWLLFFQSPPVICSRPGSGRSFSLWTVGGNRAIKKRKEKKKKVLVALVKEQLVSSALVNHVIRKWKTGGYCRVTYSHPPSVWRVWIWCRGRAEVWPPNPTQPLRVI